MAIAVEIFRERPPALERAREFLEADPVANNVFLTLLNLPDSRRVESRYVVACEEDSVVGVLFQSPVTFMATITAMTGRVVEAVVRAVAAEPPGLPSVVGEAGSAALLAGQWTETTKSAAVPDQGQRVYEVSEVNPPSGVQGEFRRAEESDGALITDWLVAFGRRVGEPVHSPDEVATRRIAAGEFWLWDHNGAVSMAAMTQAVAGVARVQAVFTPEDLRGRGFASACVASLSNLVLDSGSRCILYTELGNPISNSVYRRIGYRAVSEIVRYKFS